MTKTRLHSDGMFEIIGTVATHCSMHMPPTLLISSLCAVFIQVHVPKQKHMHMQAKRQAERQMDWLRPLDLPT